MSKLTCRKQLQVNNDKLKAQLKQYILLDRKKENYQKENITTKTDSKLNKLFKYFNKQIA